MRMYGEEVPCGVQNVLTVQVMRWEVERGNESEPIFRFNTAPLGQPAGLGCIGRWLEATGGGGGEPGLDLSLNPVWRSLPPFPHQVSIKLSTKSYAIMS